MRQFLTAATAMIAFAATPALATPASGHQFSRDDHSYRYVAHRVADGTILLTGTVIDTDSAIALRIDHGHVTGTLGSQRVSFDISPEAMARLETSGGMAIAAN